MSSTPYNEQILYYEQQTLFYKYLNLFYEYEQHTLFYEQHIVYYEQLTLLCEQPHPVCFLYFVFLCTPAIWCGILFRNYFDLVFIYSVCLLEWK
jgi:hypothetical protein